jgi:hypothetical protein
MEALNSFRTSITIYHAVTDQNTWIIAIVDDQNPQNVFYNFRRVSIFPSFFI